MDTQTNKKEVKRTQGVWQAIDLDRRTPFITVSDKNGACHYLAEIRKDFIKDDEAQANAKFICKAVNSHDELVGALRMLLAVTLENNPELEQSQAVAQADAALNKVTP